MNIELHIEALIFASDKPVTIKEIKTCLKSIVEDDISKKIIEKCIVSLTEKYSSDDFAIQIKALANGYIFMTKSLYHETLAEHLKLSAKKKLSTSAMETLSIIAYKQPVTKSEMESIRGVNCDYTVQKLLEKDLVEITGRKEGPGKPLIYGTSAKFMNYFGLKSIEDLPKIREFEETENTIGEIKDIEESNGKSASQ
ncbi:MAG: SMC-Scp complex subunit ScpB [Saprospiraceae bacterium]|nr:SMC-Scp complex subunit ScpB [Saprospiraceae bacterium]